MDVVSLQLLFNLLNYSENNIEKDEIELLFEADYMQFGKRETYELMPNGHNVLVTEANKSDYVEKMLNWRLTRGTEQQMKAFLSALFCTVQ